MASLYISKLGRQRWPRKLYLPSDIVPYWRRRAPWCNGALGINLACYDKRDKQGLRASPSFANPAATLLVGTTKARVQEYDTQGLGGKATVVLPVPPAVTTPLVPSVNSVLNVQPVNQAPEANEIFTGYISDVSPSELSEGGETHAAGGDSETGSDPRLLIPQAGPSTGSSTESISVEPPTQSGHRVHPAPALKRQKFDIPQAERRKIEAQKSAAARANILASALVAMDKLIASKKIPFMQATRAFNHTEPDPSRAISTWS
ncbi:hypothetical protein B0H10DRAFT_1962833 [Mycena sp. CBHHK59/15]|nr:hypothetical protein B0H10DRAFT_1962833 [Mycena sp. CBHHK59/15]